MIEGPGKETGWARFCNEPPMNPSSSITQTAELRTSEARYRRLFETAQDAILILDAGNEPGTIVDANPFVIDLLGYSLEELMGKELWEIGLFKDKHESQRAMDTLQRDGYIRYEGMPLETKDGRSVDVEFVSNTYLVGSEKVIQCNIRDISQRAAATRLLQASEERYRRLFETAQDAILILDEASGSIIDANPFLIELLGYSLEELMGKELWEIGLFADRDASKAAMERLQETGYIRYENLPLQTRQRETVQVEFVSNSYLVGDHRVIQCNIRDISDRKSAEEATRISHERFRFLAESMPLMIFTATPSGEIDYVTRSFAAFTGQDAEAAFDPERWSFAHPDESEEHARRWRHSIATGEMFQHECRFRNRDGVYRWHLTRASAMLDEDGKIASWIGSSTDIDDRKGLEDTLVRQYRESETLSHAKDEFLATSSHELRTPLTSILGWSELLITGDLDPATREQAIESIRASARIQSHLIDDMLDVSRLLTGKLELHREMVDIVSILQLAIRAIVPAAENKNIRITTTFARAASRVNGDPLRLQQIFWNLLSNAVKFTPSDGRIRVRLDSSQSRIAVEVSDTGEGISEEFLHRVFDRLSQEAGTSTRAHGGLGLGLSIVKQLVEMHGGTVTAESRGPGWGSTFAVNLPVRESSFASEPEAMAATPATAPAGLERHRLIDGTRVLIVDDEATMRTLISTALSGAGADVVSTASADEAFTQLSKQPFDVLVSDIAMPDEDGHSLARRIRARNDEIANIPAVALTAYGGPLQKQLALEAGFDDYLKKPFALQDLIESIAKVVNKDEAPPGHE